jgi:hypothetical protein
MNYPSLIELDQIQQSWAQHLKYRAAVISVNTKMWKELDQFDAVSLIADSPLRPTLEIIFVA